MTEGENEYVEEGEGLAELGALGYEAVPVEFLAYVNELSLGRIPSGKLALGVLLAAQMRYSPLAKRFRQVAEYYRDLVAVTKSITRYPERSLLEALTERYMQPVYVPAQYQPYPQYAQQRRRGLLAWLSEKLGL